MFVYLGFWNTIRRKFVVIGTPLSRFEHKKSSQKPIDFAYRKAQPTFFTDFSLPIKNVFIFPLFLRSCIEEKRLFVQITGEVTPKTGNERGGSWKVGIYGPYIKNLPDIQTIVPKYQ